MRPLEILLVAFAVGSALCLAIGRWRRIGFWLAAVAVADGFAHAVVEGAHWQMIPAYLAAIGAALSFWLLRPSARRLRIGCGSLLMLLALASVVCSAALPMFRLPAPTGPYAVGTATFYVTDPVRLEDAVPGGKAHREVKVQVWYPAQPSGRPLARYRELRESRWINSYQSEVLTDARLDAPLADLGSPLPVVLFDPGLNGRRTQNTSLTEDLASHGYFVAAIDHPYNAGRVAFPDGRVVEGATDFDGPGPGSAADRYQARWNREMRKWVADAELVLDRLQAMNAERGNPWFGRLDTRRVGAVGHSFGGSASTALCAVDPRIRSAVNMDGSFFAAIHMRGANQPLLVINGSPFDPNRKPENLDDQMDATDEADIKASLRKFGGYRVFARGAHHEDFTDQSLLSPFRRVNQRGTVPADTMQKIVRTYVLAFLDKTVRGLDPPILHPYSQPIPEAQLQVWPGGGRDPEPPAVAVEP